MKQCYIIRFEARPYICIADLLIPSPETCQHWHITRINVPRPLRGEGLGSKILKEITDDADKDLATLCLNPASSGDMTNAQLIGWYERNGFVKKAGYFCTMIREPLGYGY